VAFRKDLKPTFSYFPFPETKSTREPIGKFLDEKRPDLVVPKDVLSSIMKRRQKNLQRGWRSVGRVVRPEDRLIELSPRYGKDKTSFFIDQGYGLRRLSLREVKRIAGFPEYFSTPVPRNKAIKLLTSGVCPPVAHAILSEVKEWLWPM